MNDLRFAFRQLVKNPGFTVVAVITLALGIGATTAIFSVVNSVLLRPLPYKEPHRIVTVLGGGWNPVSPADFLDWRQQQTVFERIAAAQYWGGTLTGRDKPEAIPGLSMGKDSLSCWESNRCWVEHFRPMSFSLGKTRSWSSAIGSGNGALAAKRISLASR